MPTPIPLHTLNSGCHFKIIITGDGFTNSSSDVSLFNSKVTEAYNSIKNIVPFSNNLTKINFYKYQSVSQQSGITFYPASGPDIIKNTYWNTYYCEGNRVLFITNQGRQKIEDELGALSGGNRVFVIVLGNDSQYLGAGEYPNYQQGGFTTYPNTMVSYSSIHAALPFLVRHEFAHSFGNLSDEYFGTDCSGCPDFYTNDNCDDSYYSNLPSTHPLLEVRANIRTSSLRGWFEGALYNSLGYYRSSADGIMRGCSNPKNNLQFSTNNRTLLQSRINAEAITDCPSGTQFQMSAGGAWDVDDACQYTTMIPRYHDGTGSLPVYGTNIYNNSSMTSIFSGNNLWYKTLNSRIKIDYSGKVVSVYGAC